MTHWKNNFLTLAELALRRAQINYGIWDRDQKLQSDLKGFSLSRGLEIAPETDVCAMITQEFINSSLSKGFIPSGKTEDPRYWIISREFKIPKKGSKSNSFADIFINRIIPNGQKFKDISGPKSYNFPVIIEAKRAYTRKANIMDDNCEPLEDNFSAVRDDIKKLRSFSGIGSTKTRTDQSTPDLHKADDNWPFVQFYTCSLIWGFTTKGKGVKDTLEDLENELVNNNQVKDPNKHFTTKEWKGRLTRWFPHTWEQEQKNMKVLQWCWIMLIEINPFFPDINPEISESWYPPLKKV